MFDRISIRTKLIAIVAAPLAVILALAALGFVQRRADAADTQRDVRRLNAVEAAQSLQHELQREALASVTFLASDGESGREALDSQRARTDTAATGLQQAVAQLDPDETGVSIAGSALRQIGVIDDGLRVQVDEQVLAWPYALALYRQVEAALPTVSDSLTTAITDSDLADGARSLNALGDHASWQARIGALLAGAAEEGGFPEPEAGVDVKAQFDDAVDSGEVQLAVVSAEAGADTRVKLRNQMAGGDVSFFADQVDFVRQADPEAAGDLEIDPARWTRAVQATLGQLREISNEEAAGNLAAAQDRVDTAEESARLYLAGALLAVLIALGLALAVAASIARPVMSLTTAADRVAREQLPKLVEALKNPDEDDLESLRPSIEPLAVKGGAELSRLTQSVNSIQEMAVHVATEQATMLRKGIGDMFVNLARRNQGLLDRQLEFIDELEAQEEDPDQLEHLFKLDHMATRMRRNAESLLVLAGAEPTRRRGRPVPLTKVALAAVGEIEHFARIDLLEVDECDVVPKAAADIAHLLSELMENATQFSPPDSRVEVIGHRSADGYTLSISDQGIGMSADQLVEANALLARPPLLGLTLARTLGFIVVARLASRHGIAVRMVASPGGGVTALVTLPTALLVSGDPSTLDLTGGPAPVPGYDSATTAPVVSSILPPLVFHTDLAEEPAAPATLEEAVPTGRAFDAGLDRVADEAPAPLTARRPAPGPTGPVPHDRSAQAAAPGALPLRRPAEPRPPAAPPAPVTLPPRPPAAPPAPPAPLVTSPSPAMAPEPLPDGLVGAPVARAGSLFRPPAEAPPAAPLPPAPRPPEAPGPRLFGGGDLAAPAPAPGPLPARAAAPLPPPAAPLPEPPPPPAAPAELTSSGLVRRVPRAAGGTRAVPGGEGGGRGGATTSNRSPDEVRSMLSRFHSGRQAGQAPPTLDAAPLREKDS